MPGNYTGQVATDLDLVPYLEISRYVCSRLETRSGARAADLLGNKSESCGYRPGNKNRTTNTALPKDTHPYGCSCYSPGGFHGFLVISLWFPLIS